MTQQHIDDLQDRIEALVRCNPETAEQWADICAMEDVVSDWQKPAALIPRVTDNDKDEITVSLDGKELRGWSYANDDERRAKMLQAREYVEGWGDSEQRMEALVKEFEAIGPFDAETLRDLRRMIPFGLYDQGGTITQNPLTQVYFRAGLLACREYVARFVEQGGDATTAASIRANWWPSLGDDPGMPRLFDFAELCEESYGPDGKPVFKTLEVSPSVEALPVAYQFLLPIA